MFLGNKNRSAFLNVINSIVLRMIVLILVNSLFYFSTFLYVINALKIIALILATSSLEILLFLIFGFKKKVYKFIHSLSFFVLSSSKVFASMYIRQYGDTNIFSRRAQAVNLVSIGDYFIANITIFNIGIVLLSGFLAFLIFMNYKCDYNYKNFNFKSSKSIVFISVLILIFSLLTNFCADFEYYKVTASSFLCVFSENDDLYTVNSPSSLGINNKYIKPDYEPELDSDFNKNCHELFNYYNHKNEYTGIGNDKNLLVIQVESLQNAVINKSYNGIEITPNLNRLIKNSFYFSEYFELLGLGNSSDAEYVSLHSTHSTIKNGAYIDFADVEEFGLPRICNSKNYNTVAMHGNTGKYYNREEAHRNIGFEEGYYGEYYTMDEMIGMGLSDESFFSQSIPIIESKKDEKTFTFMVTLTCHAPYYMNPENIVFTEEGTENKEGDTNFERYLNAVHYSDYAIGKFLDSLDKEGILEDTVVAIYGDHHALTLTDPSDQKMVSEFLDYKFDYDEMLKIPLIIYVPGYESEVKCTNVGSQIDFLPTILNIMGWNDVVTPIFGVDLLDDSYALENKVYHQVYMVKGSYIDKNFLFEASRKNNFKGRLVDRSTREEKFIDFSDIPFEGIRKIEFSNYIYKNNMIKKLIDEFKNY